ncbi:MAG: ferrous iron transport protein A [Oscillospiraceae bacterium]|nr:ferrous iron transport protein A [Oscillospiraceae bacterium]
MHGKIRLCDMLPGQTGKVFSLSGQCAIHKRLTDLGLITGTEVECVMKSPLGDPTAYLIRGALIALRHEDAKYILIERKG